MAAHRRSLIPSERVDSRPMDDYFEELAARCRAKALETEDAEERDRLEEAAAAYEGHAIPPSGEKLAEP